MCRGHQCNYKGMIEPVLWISFVATVTILVITPGPFPSLYHGYFAICATGAHIGDNLFDLGWNFASGLWFFCLQAQNMPRG